MRVMAFAQARAGINFRFSHCGCRWREMKYSGV
jgi:hypothetical protein